MIYRGFVALSLIAVAPPLMSAQEVPPDSVPADSAVPLRPITVTATRRPTDVFAVPRPVSVIGAATIRERVPNSVADLFRDLPGLEVAGVGASQVRPVIRGQRGQRILLLEDGLRLNNARRQQDFGELPALVDVAAVDRVEVVRGPASVLYGTDAIGGVINIITSRPPGRGFHGSAGYRFSTHDNQQRVHGGLSARIGAVGMQARGSYRNTDAYSAPSGRFGEISLAAATPVDDTGVEDYSVDAYVDYRPSANERLFLRFESYQADTAGFGLVDPALFGPGHPRIQIRYPDQRFSKLVVGFDVAGLELPFADRVDVAAYFQDNERTLAFDVFVPFGGGAGLDIAQRNFTDIETLGGRLEAQKVLSPSIAVTYGIDVSRDVTNNTDTNTTAIAGPPGPPPSTTDIPLVPNASFRRVGVFTQGELRLGPRATLVVGGRVQDVRAATRATPGLAAPLVTADDRTVVGAASATVAVTERLRLIGSVGRGFRSPNLIERFFNGPTPEGVGFQSPNSALEAETSFNVDFGVRYRDRQLYLEGFVFQNRIFNGIRIRATGDTVAGLREFQNINVDELRVRGVEMSGELALRSGFAVGAGLTHLDSRNVAEDRNNPVGDGFSTRVVGSVRFDGLQRRFFAEGRARHTFERDDPEIVPGNPIGATLPAFTTVSVRAGLTVFRRASHAHRVTVGVTNLTNALYAEFANASFFRPEPGRSFVVTYDVSF